MTTRNTQPTETPATAMDFPFFGAGKSDPEDPHEMGIRFLRLPSDQERAAIIQLAPALLVEDDAFSERILMLASHQLLHLCLHPQGTGEDLDEDEYEDLPIHPEVAAAYEARLEQWLRHVHGICPIEWASRRVGHTINVRCWPFSDWHWQSVHALKALLERWNADPSLLALTHDERVFFQDCLATMLYYAEGNGDWLSDRLSEVFPLLKLGHLLKTGQHAATCAFLERHYLDAPDFLQCPQHLIPGIAHAVLRGGSRVLQSRLIARLSGHQEGGWNRDGLSNNYSQNIGARALEMFQQGDCIDAIGLFDMALSIRAPQPPTQCLALFANALYALQFDNSGLPVNSERNRKFLSLALPFGPQNPAVFFNAACLYAEMEEFDHAAQMVREAIAHRYDGMALLKRELETLPMFRAFRESQAYKALVFPEGH